MKLRVPRALARTIKILFLCAAVFVASACPKGELQKNQRRSAAVYTTLVLVPGVVDAFAQAKSVSVEERSKLLSAFGEIRDGFARFNTPFQELKVWNDAGRQLVASQLSNVAETIRRVQQSGAFNLDDEAAFNRFYSILTLASTIVQAVAAFIGVDVGVILPRTTRAWAVPGVEDIKDIDKALKRLEELTRVGN